MIYCFYFFSVYRSALCDTSLTDSLDVCMPVGRAVEVGLKKSWFLKFFLQRKTKNLKSSNFSFF